MVNTVAYNSVVRVTVHVRTVSTMSRNGGAVLCCSVLFVMFDLI